MCKLNRIEQKWEIKNTHKLWLTESIVKIYKTNQNISTWYRGIIHVINTRKYWGNIDMQLKWIDRWIDAYHRCVYMCKRGTTAMTHSLFLHLKNGFSLDLPINYYQIYIYNNYVLSCTARCIFAHSSISN